MIFFKKILLIILCATTLSANSFEFIVDNTTMVDAYNNIFSVIAALFQSPDYLQLLKLVFLLGGFFTFFMAVLGKNIANSISEFTKYMLIGTTLLTLVFSNKSEVIIKTNNLPTYCTDINSTFSTSSTTGVVVGNVPTLFAWGATFSNEFGLESTRLARTAFSSATSTTNNLSRADFSESLSSIGNIMTMSIDKIAAESSISSASTIGTTYVAITNDCVLIPAGQDNIYGEKILSVYKTSGNTKETLNDYIMNSAIVSYKNPTDTIGTIIDLSVTAGGIIPKNLLVTISGEVKTCGQAWTDLNFRLNELSANKDIACMSSFKDVLSPTALKVFTGQTILEPQLDNIVINVALANQIAESKSSLAKGNNNINEMSYATSKTIAEVTLKSKASGDYLAEMLPYLQMGMRAVLYGFFPFVFVVILLPGGLKVLMEYMKSVIWIELWTPAAAILDMFLNIQATDKFANMYNNTGMNPMSFFQVFSDASMLSGVAGYLYASVPAITWLILGSTGEMLSNIGNGLMGGMARGSSYDDENDELQKIHSAGIGGKNILEKNLDSRTQNSDKALKQVSNITGATVAKVEAMSIEHSAKQNAGNWMTNEEHKGSLVDTGKGAALQKIMSGSAVQDIYGGNSDAQKSFRIKEQQDQINIKETQVATGTQDGDKKVMQSIGKTMGQEENQKIVDAAYKQKALGTNENDPTRVAAVAAVRGITAKAANDLDASTQKELGIDMASDKDGSKMKAYVETKTNEFMTNYESERKTQEIFGGGDKSINVRSNNAAETKLKSVSEFNSEVETQMKNNKGMIRSEAIVKSASIIGKQNGLKESEIQERLDAFAGEKGKLVNGKLTYSKDGNERLEKTVDNNARVAAHTAAGEGKTNATNKELESAAKIKKDTMVAEQNAIPKLNKNTMKAAVQMGDKTAIALEKKISHYSEARKSMARAAFMKSTLGVFGDVSSKVSKSAEAGENSKLGLNATQKGEYTSEKLIGTINSDKNALKALFATAFKIDPKTKIKVLDKNSNSYKVIRRVMAKAGLKGEGVMSLSNINAAVIGKTSMSVMGNKSTAFNTSVDNTTVNRLQHNGITTKVMSDSDVTDIESTRAKNEVIIDAIKTDQGGITQFEANKLYGETEAVMEIIRAAELGIEILAEGLSSLNTGRNSKVTEANRKLAIESSEKIAKEKIVKENQLRITELIKSEKDGNQLTKAEVSEKNRLISENKSLNSEIKVAKEKISSFKSEIRSSTKTGVDNFKDLYREKSIEEKMAKTDEAGKVKLAEQHSLKPKVENGSGKISGGLKVLGAAGIGYTVYEGVKEGNQRIQMNDNAGAAIVGGKTAAIIGAGLVVGEAGATIGATVGTLIFPGVGTAIGGFAGGIVGGAIGGISASIAGDSVLNMYDNREVREMK